MVRISDSVFAGHFHFVLYILVQYLVPSDDCSTYCVVWAIEKSVLRVYRVLPLLPRLPLLLLCTAVVGAAVLLLPAAVRHRVPDGQICCWFIESDPGVLFLLFQSSFKRDLYMIVTLGSTVSHLRPRCSYILGKYGHARSQGRPQRAAAKPPL